MKRIWVLIGSLFLMLFLFTVILAGCGQQETLATTPIPTIEELPLVAVDVPLTTLLRNPYSFEGENVRISGRYKPLPLMACKNDPHVSPATWVLSEGEIEVPAAGFDEVLRELKRTDTDLVVEGRWQFWDGPVGCGRRAPEEEVWHLQVSRIVSPNPLSLEVISEQEIVSASILTSTVGPPPSVTEELGSEPTPAIPAVASSTLTTTPQPSSTPIVTATLRPTNTPEAPPLVTPNATRTPTPRPTETGIASGSPTSTPTATEGAVSLTESPTPTRTPSPEPSATPTVQSGGGALSFERIVRSELGVEGVHYWDFDSDSGQIISLSVGPGDDLDVALALIDPEGTTIAVTNDGIAGIGESINEITLTRTGEYRIEVRAVGGSSGDYSIVITDSDSEAFLVFKEYLSFGDVGTGSLPANTDHLWNFEASAGEVVTIRIEPANSGDLVLFLISPDSDELEFIDDGGPGEAELLSQYVITESGIYSIRVGELEFQPASYTVTLDGL